MVRTRNREREGRVRQAEKQGQNENERMRETNEWSDRSEHEDHPDLLLAIRGLPDQGGVEGGERWWPKATIKEHPRLGGNRGKGGSGESGNGVRERERKGTSRKVLWNRKVRTTDGEPSKGGQGGKAKTSFGDWIGRELGHKSTESK